MTETAERHVASYDVLLDGESIPREHRDRIKEIRVLDDLRLPDVCSVVVAYPRGDTRRCAGSLALVGTPERHSSGRVTVDGGTAR